MLNVWASHTGYIPVYRRTAAKFRHKGLIVLAIMDDIYFIVDPEDANEVVDYFRNECREI